MNNSTGKWWIIIVIIVAIGAVMFLFPDYKTVHKTPIRTTSVTNWTFHNNVDITNSCNNQVPEKYEIRIYLVGGEVDTYKISQDQIEIREGLVLVYVGGKVIRYSTHNIIKFSIPEGWFL